MTPVSFISLRKQCASTSTLPLKQEAHPPALTSPPAPSTCGFKRRQSKRAEQPWPHEKAGGQQTRPHLSLGGRLLSVEKQVRVHWSSPAEEPGWCVVWRRTPWTWFLKAWSGSVSYLWPTAEAGPGCLRASGPPSCDRWRSTTTPGRSPCRLHAVPYHPPCTFSTWARDVSPSIQAHRGTWYTHTHTHTHTWTHTHKHTYTPLQRLTHTQVRFHLLPSWAPTTRTPWPLAGLHLNDSPTQSPLSFLVLSGLCEVLCCFYISRCIVNSRSSP